MRITRREELKLGGLGAAGLVAAGGLGEVALLGLKGHRRGPGAGDGGARLLSTPGVTIQPRSAWGADESLRVQSPIFAPIRQLFVHHTVTANGAAPVPTIQSIYRSHLAEGFIDIGYNFLIDASGTIWEGRFSRAYPGGQTPLGQNAAGMGVVGAHVANHDVGSVGVAMLGTFLTVAPTNAALNTLLDLLAFLADSYGLDPMGTTGGEPVIAGHRDANQTACPGDDCYDQLPGIRQQVVSRIQANAGKGTMAAPTCTLLVPSGISASTTPTVRGQASRSAQQVNITFAGATGQHTVPAAASNGTFTSTVGSASGPTSLLGGLGGLGGALGGSAGLGGLPADTYQVTAVAVDGAGNASAPTMVASSFQVEPGANLPGGYWILGADGGVFSYGQAGFLRSTGGQRLNAPVVAMEAVPSGRGYWLVASDGGIFNYGSAGFFGSTGGIRLNKPIVGITSSPTGNGYRLVASDGGIFSFGDAPFFGSAGGIRLNKPIVGMAPTPSGAGYWLVASDGGLFSYGDAGFFGSAAGRGSAAPPIVAMAPTPSGHGYWILDTNGGVYNYGDAANFGSVPGSGVTDLNVVGLAATPSGGGYYIVNSSGKVYAFGAAPGYGDALTSGLEVDAIGVVVLG